MIVDHVFDIAIFCVLSVHPKQWAGLSELSKGVGLVHWLQSLTVGPGLRQCWCSRQASHSCLPTAAMAGLAREPSPTAVATQASASLTGRTGPDSDAARTAGPDSGPSGVSVGRWQVGAGLLPLQGSMYALPHLDTHRTFLSK